MTFLNYLLENLKGIEAKSRMPLYLQLMPWLVYIIQCKDKTLYTGITSNLSKRISAHNSRNGCRYTKYRYPVKLIYSEKKPTKSEALKRKSYIKNLVREKKLHLSKTLRPSGSVFNSTKFSSIIMRGFSL